MKFLTTNAEIFEFYTTQGLFFDGRCPSCRKPMDLIRLYNSAQGTQEPVYYCKPEHIELKNRHCTIFHNMKINYTTFEKIFYFFISGFSTHQIQVILTPLESRVPTTKTIKNLTKKFLKIIHVYVQRSLVEMKLPGPVELDESCLYRFRKNNMGRVAKTIYRVFGMKCRLTKQTIVYPVLYRTKKQLIPYILLHVNHGATIYTDRFSSYFNNRVGPPASHLEIYGYRHIGINHSIHFVSQICRTIHINTVERMWRSLKERFKYKKPRVHITHHISQFMFESWVPQAERYQFMLRLIKHLKEES